MHVLALDLRLRLPQVQSLKQKRSVIRPVLDRLPKLGVSIAETGHNDSWQNARLGVAIVSSTARQATEIMDEAERIVWSRPDLEVVSADRTWMEIDT